MNAVLVLLTVVVALAFSGCAEGQVRPQTDADTIKYSRQGYEALFTVGVLHDIEIVFTQAEWDALLRDMHDYAAEDPSGKPLTGTYHRATFAYKGPAGDAVIEEVGFRVKGNYSRPYPEDKFGDFSQAHFKVKFNKAFDQVEGTPEWEDRNQRRFAKQRELELRMHLYNGDTGIWDTTQIRELYGYELMRRAGTNTSRTGATHLTITVGGVEHDFGIYTLVEQVDKSFLTKRYGSGANDGNLYKNHWGDSGPANLGPIDDPNNFQHPYAGNPRIIGVKDWENHYRPTYDLKTNTDNPDFSDLLDFIDKINTLEGQDFVDYMEANFEVDKFIRYLAMNFLMGKWDDYWSIGNNYFLYFNNDGKIEFYSVDYDMAFGDGWSLFDTANVGLYEWGGRNRQLLRLLAPQISEEDLAAADWEYPLVDKVLAITDYRHQYEAYVEEFINPANGLFLYSEFEKMFNLMYPVYLPYLDNEMGEGTEMYINDRVKRYYYDKTRSVIQQLGLDEADYEIPPFGDLPVGMPSPEVTVTAADDDVPAEEDWVSNPANGHHYVLTRPMDWTRAEARAVALGGHLVTVNDREEELWLREQFGTQERFWLGFSDLAVEGNWEWTSGEPATYSNWASGQPDDYRGIEDAAVMNWSASGQGGDGWNDEPMAGRYRAIVESAAQAGLRPVELTLSSLSVSPGEVVLGSPVTVTARVTNAGDVEGTYPATLTVGGGEVASRDVVVAGGATETVRFTFTRSTAGTCTVRLGELSGTFEVLSESDIAARAAEAMREAKSYQGDTTFTMAMKVEAEGEVVEAPMVMGTDYAIDIENRQYEAHITVTAGVPGEGGFETGVEMYLLEGILYTLAQMPGEPAVWVAEAAPAGTWEALQVLPEQAALLDDAEVTLLGTEKVDGVDCYKLGVVTDRQALLDAILAQQSLAQESSGVSDDAGAASFLAMFDELVEMSATQWVTTDTYLLRRAEMAVALDMVSMGLSLSMAVDINAWGYGEPVVIELPEEAQEATIVAPAVETYEVVTFPDANLEAAIRSAIGKPEGSILRSDLEGLTHLSASRMSITDLTGLEHCSNLATLSLSANQVTDITPLASLTDLTILNLGWNQISDISSLASLTGLTTLYLSANQVTDISPLASLTNLAWLFLTDNQISDISPLASLTDLASLVLVRNQISDISPLASLTNLTVLELSGNQIGDIGPLVRNEGLSDGDFVRLGSNPLSTTSVDAHIPELQERGVDVSW